MKNGELYEGNTLDQIWPKQGIGISNALEERLLVVVPEVLQDIAEHSPAVRQRDVPEIGA
jgi:hypothetical protein